MSPWGAILPPQEESTRTKHPVSIFKPLPQTEPRSRSPVFLRQDHQLMTCTSNIFLQQVVGETSSVDRGYKGSTYIFATSPADSCIRKWYCIAYSFKTEFSQFLGVLSRNYANSNSKFGSRFISFLIVLQ